MHVKDLVFQVVEVGIIEVKASLKKLL